MKGTPDIPFTALIADTILAHGTGWAWRYYAKRLPPWELQFWWSTPPVRRATVARACYQRALRAQFPRKR